MEAALFVPSGTMGNAIAIRILTERGDEVLAERRSHVVRYELSGMSVLSGVMPRMVDAPGGHLTPEHVRAAVAPKAYYKSDVSLVVLENTHNLGGGTVQGVEEFQAVVAAARECGFRVHLDGARVWNAAVALGVPPAALVKGVDTVMACLSKGLCAPVGSVVASSRERIERARRARKLLGGGMRQAGVIAAGGPRGPRHPGRRGSPRTMPTRGSWARRSPGGAASGGAGRDEHRRGDARGPNRARRRGRAARRGGPRDRHGRSHPAARHPPGRLPRGLRARGRGDRASPRVATPPCAAPRSSSPRRSLSPSLRWWRAAEPPSRRSLARAGAGPARRSPRRGGLGGGPAHRPADPDGAPGGRAAGGGDRGARPARRRQPLLRHPRVRPRPFRHRGHEDGPRRRPRGGRPRHGRPRHLRRPPQRLLLRGHPARRAGRGPDREQQREPQLRLGRDLGRGRPRRRRGLDGRARHPLQDPALPEGDRGLGAQRPALRRATAGDRPLDGGAARRLDLEPLRGGAPRGALRRATGPGPRRPALPLGRSDRRDGRGQGRRRRLHERDSQPHRLPHRQHRLRGDGGGRPPGEPDPFSPLLPGEAHLLPRGGRDLRGGRSRQQQRRPHSVLQPAHRSAPGTGGPHPRRPQGLGARRSLERGPARRRDRPPGRTWPRSPEPALAPA